MAANNFYFTPARQTRDVGKYIAEMIDFMCKERGADIRKFHLIGHSLGAHTVGYAGMYTTSGRIPRITGTLPKSNTITNILPFPILIFSLIVKKSRSHMSKHIALVHTLIHSFMPILTRAQAKTHKRAHRTLKHKHSLKEME